MYTTSAIRPDSPGPARQRGMTLIVVLLILVVLTLLGITGMRMGLSSLNVATNSQVSSLLYQSADAGLFHLERVVAADILAAVKPGGVLAAISTDGREDTFCLSTRQAAVTLVAGACSTGNPANFMSGRQAVLTQVQVKNRGMTTAPQIGSDAGLTLNYAFTMTATSVLPSFGSASNTEIDNCLTQAGDDTVKNGNVESTDPAIETASECLTSDGAVTTTLVDDYQIVYERL
jgi:Tfp pilus assembly protein PilX